MMEDSKQKLAEKALIYTARALVLISLLFIVCGAIFISTLFWREPSPVRTAGAEEKAVIAQKQATGDIKTRVIPANAWKAPDERTIPSGKYGNMIRYGKELIVHTSKYFGPNGSVAHMSNGMNCQNCHMAGGTKLFANNYSDFISGYPRKSSRSGKIEPASARIAECFDRSLAGKAPDQSGKEVQAMLAYMKWVGTGIKKGDKVFGSATEKLKYLDRAADAKRGSILFQHKCKSCHGANGEGVMAEDKLTYVYPPLWGKHSYNDGAGMYRLSKFAGFVKNNMPFGATYADSQLTDEEAWDLAAFVNSQPRPHRDPAKDYPDLTKKPFDSPYGPYADKYTEEQHKYGPFAPVIASANQAKSIIK